MGEIPNVVPQEEIDSLLPEEYDSKQFEEITEGDLEKIDSPEKVVEKFKNLEENNQLLKTAITILESKKGTQILKEKLTE